MRSADPTDEFAADFEATAGSDDTTALRRRGRRPARRRARLPRFAAPVQEQRLPRQRVPRPRRHLRARRARGARQARLVAERSARGGFRGPLRRRRQRLRRVGDRQRLQHVLRQAGPRRAALDRGLDPRASGARGRRHREHLGRGRHRRDVQLRRGLGQRRVLGAVRLRLHHDQRPRAAHLQSRGARAVEARRDRGRARRLARRRLRARSRRRATITSISASTRTRSAVPSVRSIRTIRCSASTTRPTSRCSVRCGSRSALASSSRRVARGAAQRELSPTRPATASIPTTTWSAASSRSAGASAIAARRICGSRAATRPAASTSRSRASTSTTSTTAISRREEIEFDPESLTSVEAGYRASSADGRCARGRRRVLRAPRRPADQDSDPAAARRPVVVPARDGELGARRALRARGDVRLARDRARRAVRGARLAAHEDRPLLAVPGARGPRAGARARRTPIRSAPSTARRRAGGAAST